MAQVGWLFLVHLEQPGFALNALARVWTMSVSVLGVLVSWWTAALPHTLWSFLSPCQHVHYSSLNQSVLFLFSLLIFSEEKHPGSCQALLHWSLLSWGLPALSLPVLYLSQMVWVAKSLQCLVLTNWACPHQFSSFPPPFPAFYLNLPTYFSIIALQFCQIFILLQN